MAFQDYESRYSDPIVNVLIENKVGRAQIDEAADALADWIDGRDSTEEIYLIVNSRSVPRTELTPHKMATEIREHTRLGMSFVEAFVAGAVTNPHQDLKESLEILRSET